MQSRRNAIEKIFKSGAALSFGGLFWTLGTDEATDVEFALRPPGAIDDKEFLAACIKCGHCVEACPYDTLKLATPGEGKFAGTPFMEPREIPCYMCQDIPCTNVCPSGALSLNKLKKDNSKPEIDNCEIGLAVVHKESCIAHWGIQCDACYRACPLIDKAITLKKEINRTTNKHANMVPVINSEYCTGCGLCEHTCVVEKSAIFILPKDKATGKVASHYIKSWDKKDEQRINENQKTKSDDNDVNSALDYLNNDEELFD